MEQYGIVIGTDNPDLTAFRDRGGKAIVWHGWADQLITAEGSIDYYTRVQQEMGGPKKTSEFIRSVHGARRDALRRRRGPAADRSARGTAGVGRRRQGAGDAAGRRGAIRRGAVTRSRPLCAYPLVAKYKGSGSTDEAANFTCSSGF